VLFRRTSHHVMASRKKVQEIVDAAGPGGKKKRKKEMLQFEFAYVSRTGTTRTLARLGCALVARKRRKRIARRRHHFGRRGEGGGKIGGLAQSVLINSVGKERKRGRKISRGPVFFS